jgi:hypothetical protein
MHWTLFINDRCHSLIAGGSQASSEPFSAVTSSGSELACSIKTLCYTWIRSQWTARFSVQSECNRISGIRSTVAGMESGKVWAKPGRRCLGILRREQSPKEEGLWTCRTRGHSSVWFTPASPCNDRNATEWMSKWKKIMKLLFLGTSPGGKSL